MKKQSSNLLAKRLASLMPNGIPRWVRIYKAEGQDVSWDEYTAVFTGAACAKACGGHPYMGIGNSGQYYHGSDNNHAIDVNKDGFAPAVGRKNHLGRRVRFEDLNADVQNTIREEYIACWNIRPGYYYGEKDDGYDFKLVVEALAVEP